MQDPGGQARLKVVGPGTAAVAWAAIAVFILYGSINPFSRDRARYEALPGISLPDIAQNMLLYIPFGICGVWALRRDSSSRRGLVARVAAIAVVYSSTMELLQLGSPSRFASSLDVLANAAGAWAGAVSSDATERALRIAADSVRPTGLLTEPARYLLAAALAAIVLTAWYPFDVTLDVSTLSDRTRAVRQDPWLSTGSTELWTQGGRFFVLAALLTACLPGLAKHAAWVAALAAMTIAVIVDLGQLAMGSHPVGGAVLLSQAAGAGAGAAAMFRWRDRRLRHSS
jgi:VanZ family protein